MDTRSRWRIFALFVFALVFGYSGAELREKRAVDVNEQPKVVTTDGHLLFQTGANHNITFKTGGGTGRVIVGDVDLIEIINTVNENKVAIQSLQELSQQVQQLSADLEDVKARVSVLEQTGTGGGDPSPALESRISELESQVNTLATDLNNDECSSNPCLNGGTCINLYKDYQCTCADGWMGTTCSQDVNECQQIVGTMDACQNFGTCVNLQGSYRCDCTADWYGPQCTIQHDDCGSASDSELCGHGYCVNVNRVQPDTPKYSCICFDGWTSDPDSNNPACSLDIDECAAREYPCSSEPLVSCTNVVGTYYCGNCPTGYTGNGHQCNDVNECLTNNGGCSTAPLVMCINTIGSRECGSCPAGYVGDGVVCVYVGICNLDNGGCSSLATCSENSGVSSGRVCSCPDGYSGDGEGSNGCIANPSSCATNPCINGGRCQDQGSSYLCICAQGYEGNNCETDINECSSNPCLNDGTCVDQVNGYTCNCASGYSGDTCADVSVACGGYYTGLTGSFSFPGNGQSYPHGASCAWIITTNIDKVIVLTFDTFKIEEHVNCDYDFLQINDGPSATSYAFGRFCGTTAPDPITTTHNQVYMWFKSDGSVSAEGFQVRWSSIDPVCGGTLESSNHGDISSPGYPGNYPPNRDCTWSITVEAGRYITFAFASLDLEVSDDCSNDYLEVFDGLSEDYAVLGQYCTAASPPPFSTTGPYAFVRFHSDEVNVGSGFHVTYISAVIDPGCGGLLTSDSGIIISPNYPNQYDHNADCVWTIQVVSNEVIFFVITDLEIEVHGNCLYDYIEVRDGFDETAPFVGRYCDGSNIPPPIISSTNEMYVKFHSDTSRSFGGFRATYEVYCGGTFTEDNGEVVSPYFPNQYPHSKTCEYFITAGSDQAVHLTFLTFDMEFHDNCQYDYLEVRNGSTADSALIATLCGSNLPDPITSSGSGMYLKFVTDGSISNYGFRATYTFVENIIPDDGCGGMFTDSAGMLQSPPHPEGYPHGAHCVYNIQVEELMVIRLTFQIFNLEAEATCRFDYVAIYDNETTSDTALVGRYCGNTLPPVFTSSGNIATLLFHTDSNIAYEGFVASYVSLDASSVCGGDLTSSIGVISSPNFPDDYPANIECIWTITVPEGQQISLHFANFSTEYHQSCNFDALEIRNGGYSTSPLIGSYCGTDIIVPEITSHSNRLYLKFTSDSSVSSSGFFINYDGTSTGCGGSLDTPSGSIMSPNYPYPYGHNAECFWDISVSQGHIIMLIFVELDLESHSSCAYDYLKVYDGDSEASNLLGTFCGTTIPAPIESTGNRLHIKWRTDYSVGGNGFYVTYLTSCDHVRLTETTGYIESQNYPDPYPHDRACVWIIEASLGNTINITIVDIHLEESTVCAYDYLRLRDGQEEDSPEIVTLCGNGPDGVSYASTGQYLMLEFSSDASLAYDGFQALYTIIGCGEDLQENSGSFQSLNFPEPYDHSRVCEWKIHVDLGRSIALTFETVDLEKSTNCQFDALEVYSGLDDSGLLLTRICNSQTSPQVVSATTNQMFVRFKTDASVNGGGFNATYNSIEGVCITSNDTAKNVTEGNTTIGCENGQDCVNSTVRLKNITETVTPSPNTICYGGCGGNFSTPTGNIHSPNYPASYPHNTDCNWLITVAENHRVQLTFTAFNLESSTNCVYDYVKLYDGDDTSAAVLATHCSNTLPDPDVYYSTNNQMFVRMLSDSSVAYIGFAASYETACGGRKDATLGGFISSPNFPEQYEGNHNCSWIIESPNPTDRVTLTFTDLDLETSATGCFDYVEVRDGNDLSAPIAAGPICGTSIPSPVTSQGSSMVVNFISDANTHGTGFRALYSTTGAACGGSYTSTSGSFSSPGYPNSYPQSTECVWTITVPAGSRVQITFTLFEIESSSGCSSDYLEVKDNDESGSLVGKLCGNTLPSNLTVSSSVWLRFVSDGTGTAAGFVASYQIIYGGDLTGSSGEIMSPGYPSGYPSLASISWSISVASPFHILLTFIDFGVEYSTVGCSFDALRIYDGINNQASLLVELCGVNLPSPVLTTGSTGFLEFTTDGSVSLTGFFLQWEQIDSSATRPPVNASVAPSGAPGCDQSLVALSSPQTFSSPGYPANYGSNLLCTWTITGPERLTIMLNFTYFELEGSTSCAFDVVRVYDGISTSAPLLATLCNRDDVAPLYSTSNFMTIVLQSDSSVEAPGFLATYQSHCGGTFTMTSGVITSPGYPSTYLPNLNCTYIIKTTESAAISLLFIAFDLEQSANCDKDSLTLYNGGDVNSPPLGNGVYCGTTLPGGSLQTSSNVFWAHFVTDDSGESTGFSFSYTTQTAGCGGHLSLTDSTTEGVLTSPNYPENYPQNVDCIWLLSAPAETTIMLEFTDFYIETHSSCQFDYLEVRDGSLSSAPLLAKLCGDTVPLPITSTGNAMYLRMRTDSTVANVGFSLKYKLAPCGGLISGSSGEITSPGYPDSYGNDEHCDWYFQGPTGHYLTISFPEFTLDSQNAENCTTRDNIIIYDGRNESSHTLGQYCGVGPQLDVETSSNIAFIKFISDSRTNSGTSNFKIQFVSSEEVCGGDLQTPTGTLSSPDYPQPYAHSRVCEWRITVQEGYRVNLYFTDLDIEVTGSCIFDSVAVYNGLEDDAPLLGRFCGVEEPDVVSSSGRGMKIVFTTDSSVNGRGFFAHYDSQDASVCGGTLTTTPPGRGYIMSPGYGISNYSSNVLCEWTISNTLNVNSSLELTFIDEWRLEAGSDCRFDYVEIRHGTDSSSPLIGRYCGDTIPDPISVPWNTVFIIFRTDSSVVDTGFRMQYESRACGGIVSGTEGIITSPNFPSNYDHNDNCAWIIEAPEGNTITISFTDFAVETHVNCEYDYLAVRNGGNWDSPLISGEHPWCGSVAPIPITSGSNQLIVVFSTDASSSAGGFRMVWTTDSSGCGGTFAGNSGTLQSVNYPSDYSSDTECIWYIKVESGYVVSLTFDNNFNLASGDYVTVYDGTDISDAVLGSYSGSTAPSTLQSTTVYMTVKFQSDAFAAGTGFKANWTTGCGATFNSPGGRIVSPGFPSRSYDSNLDCQYLINYTDSTKMLITFDDIFEIEDGSGCQYDYLALYAGMDATGDLIGRYCGTTTPGQIVQMGPVFVVFHSDASLEDAGFGFNFEPDCGGIFTDEVGTIGTPTHVDTYNHNQNCTWLITVMDGWVVELRFTTFELEMHSACDYDYLQIYDGDNFGDPLLTNPLCGSALPSPVISTGNSMFLNFVTDSSVSYEGFQATYTSRLGASVGCGGNVVGDSGVITSVDTNGDGLYENDLDCVWQISLPDVNKVLILEFISFNIEDGLSSCDYDYLEIRDGFGSLAPLVGRFCSSIAPATVVLSGNQAYMRFYTDASAALEGFEISYSSVNRTCGGALNATSESQMLTSPNYPNEYPSSLRCTWTISASGVDKVRLNTTVIDIEDHRNCEYDYIQFADFPLTDGGQSIHYCGQTLPPLFDSAGQSVQVYFVTDINSAGAGFSISYQIADCNQEIEAVNGALTSPGYPGYYSNLHDCTTLLTVPSNMFISLFFTDFNLEANSNCAYDYLKISDGGNADAAEIATLCGAYVPDSIYTSGNQVFLEFHTDTSIQHAGYSITYTSSPIAGCGGNLSGKSGSFTSPLWPAEYPANLTCEWTIQVPARGQPIQLEFTHLNIEGTEGLCESDAVEVYQGSTASDPLMGRYCGTNLPAVLTGTRNPRNFLVRFTTNGLNAENTTFTGFRATYTS